MKILIIFAHNRPNSLTGQIKGSFEKGLKEGGHQTDTLDLHKIGWKPVLYEEDEPDYSSRGNQHFSEEVKREQERLLNYDAIAFVFPTYWWNMPAILKGYIDRVFNYEYAYGTNRKLSDKVKKLLWVTLMGTTPTTKYEKCHEVMDYLYNVGIGELCDINDSRVVKFVDIKNPTQEETKEYFDRAYSEGLTF
ncbi:flavodoxin-like protein [Backusella circina FSU 941]|nr:flavodoxin-like protein [Backusella circina FSU 941]